MPDLDEATIVSTITEDRGFVESHFMYFSQLLSEADDFGRKGMADRDEDDVVAHL